LEGSWGIGRINCLIMIFIFFNILASNASLVFLMIFVISIRLTKDGRNGLFRHHYRLLWSWVDSNFRQLLLCIKINIVNISLNMFLKLLAFIRCNFLRYFFSISKLRTQFRSNLNSSFITFLYWYWTNITFLFNFHVFWNFYKLTRGTIFLITLPFLIIKIIVNRCVCFKRLSISQILSNIHVSLSHNSRVEHFVRNKISLNLTNISPMNILDNNFSTKIFVVSHISEFSHIRSIITQISTFFSL